jgi:hypothetical protein
LELEHLMPCVIRGGRWWWWQVDPSDSSFWRACGLLPRYTCREWPLSTHVNLIWLHVDNPRDWCIPPTLSVVVCHVVSVRILGMVLVAFQWFLCAFIQYEEFPHLHMQMRKQAERGQVTHSGPLGWRAAETRTGHSTLDPCLQSLLCSTPPSCS